MLMSKNAYLELEATRGYAESESQRATRFSIVSRSRG